MNPAPKIISLGVVAGVVGGLFGVGGGIIIVPGLMLWSEMDQHSAHGTSVATIVVTASAAMIPFAIDGEVRWDLVGWILSGALAGAYLGARLIVVIPRVWLARAFFALLITTSIRFLVPS